MRMDRGDALAVVTSTEEPSAVQCFLVPASGRLLPCSSPLSFQVNGHSIRCRDHNQLLNLVDCITSFTPGVGCAWMSNLDPSRKWTELCFPSTHNSATFMMDPSTLAWSKLLHVTPHLRGFVAQWTCCQSLTLYEQLRLGVRALDLRISTHAGTLWVSHKLACVPLAFALLDVRRFLMQTQREVVLVFVKPDWDHREGLANREAVAALEKECALIFGSLPMCADCMGATLQELNARGQRCALIWTGGGEHPPGPPFLPSEPIFQGNWANTNAIPVLRQSLESAIQHWGPRQPSTLREFSAVLTPQTSDVIDALKRFYSFRTRESLLSYAAGANSLLLEFLNTQPEHVALVANVITVDHPTEDLIRSILRLNGVVK